MKERNLKLECVLQENVMHLLIQIPVTFVTMFLRHTSNLKIQAVLNRNCGLACQMTAKSPQPLTAQKHFTVTWNRASKQPIRTFSSCQLSCLLQEETYIKLRSVDCSRSQGSATAKRHEQINDICSKFRSGQITRAEYMRQIAFKFLPVHVSCRLQS